MLTVDVRSRVAPELKSEASAVLKGMGLDLSTAIRLFLRNVVDSQGASIMLPKPNETTLQAIADAKAGKVTAVGFEAL